jgi:hypothetical protein
VSGRRGYAGRASAGTDASGMTAADREAVRAHRTRTLGGGLVSKRYHQDIASIDNGAPAPARPDPYKSK